MSLTIALNSALTTMTTAQYNTSVASTNIANADTDGYTVKSAENQAIVIGNSAVGVEAGALSSDVDANLIKSLNESISEVGYTATLESYLAFIEEAFGSVTDDSSVTELIADIETQLSTLSIDPSSSSDQYATVNSLVSLADKLNDLTDEIQSQRDNADDAIAATIDQINQKLETLDDLNDQIAAATAIGDATADLEDLRNTALLELSEMMNITYFTDSNNRVNVYTESGTAILTSTYQELSYDSVGTVSSTVTYPGGFDNIEIGGTDITGEISGGTLGALIELRDETLPDLQEEIDELAENLIEQVNAISNTGTSYPAPNDLTGTTAVTATDPVSATGEVRIAVTDEEGAVVEFFDLDLTTVADVQDVIDEINTNMTSATASVNADGVLEIIASNSDEGIAINEMDSSVGTDAEGFSSYFGFNDIFTGSDASDIAVLSALQEDPTSFPGGQLNDDAALSVGDNGIASGDATTVSALLSMFSDEQSMDAAGGIAATSSTFSDYASTIHSNLSLDIAGVDEDAAMAETNYSSLADTLSSETGVSLDEEIAALSLYQESYEAGAYVLSLIQELFDTLMNSVS